MIQRHVALYLGSRIAAAILNLLSVAAFARLAGPAAYGEYLIVFAWAFIVYAFTIQWLRFSFFAGFRLDEAADQITTFGSLVLASIAVVAVACLALATSGLLPPDKVLATGALVVALALYDAAYEVGRSRLKAGPVAVTVLLRALLMLMLGSAAIVWIGTPAALAWAVAIAHVIAMLPLFGEVRPLLGFGLQRAVAWRFLAYGWPLILAFGLGSVALNLDRLLLERFAGAEAVGAYGAVSNVIKQTYFVVGEAIAGAYIALAKRSAGNGEHAQTGEVLLQAFRAFAATAAFGLVGFVTLGPPLLELLVGPQMWQPVSGLILPMVLAGALMVFRTFYFGQVIFFAKSSRIELLVAAVDAATVAVSGVLLVPTYGMAGAAAALLLGQIVGCALYVYSGRTLYPMPVSLADLIGISALAGIGLVACLLVDAVVPLRPLELVMEAAILAAAFLVAVRLYDLFGMGELAVARLWARREHSAPDINR